MNHIKPTAGEKAAMREIAKLMTLTLSLAAHHPDNVKSHTTDNPENPRSARTSVSASQCDLQLLLGGGGTNFKNVRELGAMACPSGCYLDLTIETPEGRNTPVPLPRLPELAQEVRGVMIKALGDWHRILTGAAVAPRIRCESTDSAEVFIVDGRDIPKAAMSALRRIVGWACFCNGRLGFLEWESLKH